MAGVTIIVDAGASGTYSREQPLKVVDISRIVTWSKANLFQDPAELITNPTNAEALDRWMKWMLQTTRDHVLADERKKAVVSDIEMVG